MDFGEEIRSNSSSTSPVRKSNSKLKTSSSSNLRKKLFSNSKNATNFDDDDDGDGGILKEERFKYEDYIGDDLTELLRLERKFGFRMRKSRMHRSSLSYSRWSNKIYQLMTEPRSSILAFFIALFIILVIILSIVVFFVQSWPTFWDRNSLRTTWFLLETFIIAVFTLEFTIRMLTAPDKHAFFFSIFTVIDIFSIVPYFAYCILVLTESKPFDPTWIAILKTIRLFTLFRLLKLGRYTTFFEAGYGALKNSIDALALMVLSLFVVGFFFSSLIFYAEQTEEVFNQSLLAWVYTIDNPWTDSIGPFQSIAASYWWWIVSASTVGYGDTFPITGLGKAVAGFTVISGIIMFGLPIGIFGVRFSMELSDINFQRSIKLYSYKHSGIIAKQRLKKIHKRLHAFQSELLNLRDIYDQLADANAQLIHTIDLSMRSLEKDYE